MRREGTPTDKLRIGIVGLGRVAPAHIRAVERAGDLAELAALVSRRRNHAAVLAQQHQIPKVYASLDEALATDSVDAFVLCSPNHLHAVQAVACARAKRHVLVEKPLANSIAEADAMIAAAAEHGVVLMVAQCRRFTEAVRQAKARLEAIGPIFSIIHTLAVHFPGPATDWWASAEATGGLVLGLNGPHVVDTICWFFGQRPIRVQATAVRHNQDWEGEDEAALLLDFPGGGIGVAHLSFNAAHGVNERFVVGARGTMHLTNETRLAVSGQVVVDEVYGPYLEGGLNFDAQMREFLTAIRDGRTPIASASEVRVSVEILEAARCAIQTGAAVYLPARS